MGNEAAETGDLRSLLAQIGTGLDEYLKFEHPDALHPGQRWREHLNVALPREGIGIQRLVAEIVQQVIPNGSAVARPGSVPSSPPAASAQRRSPPLQQALPHRNAMA